MSREGSHRVVRLSRPHHGATRAGKTQKIKQATAKAIKSVASPFGLRSGLRQSGSRFAAVFRREAEASLYLAAAKAKATTKVKAKAMQTRRQDKREMQNEDNHSSGTR
jgi:hypothetical protein